MKLLSLSIILVAFISQSISIDILKIPEFFTSGKHHVVIFNVTNKTSETVKPKFKLEIPEGWGVVTKPFVTSIKGNKSVRLIYTLSLDSKVKPGEAKITLVVTQNNQEPARKEIKVRVAEIHKIKIAVQSKPDYVLAEKEFSCTYSLTNYGNVREQIKLSSREGFLKDNIAISVPVDSTIIVEVFQKSKEILNKPQTIVNDVIVYLVTQDTNLTKNTTLLGYPSVSGAGSLYQGEYLVEGGLAYNIFNVNESQLSVFQYDIKGSGFLNLDKTKLLEFSLRGTDKPKLTRFETYNKYSLRYKDKKNDLYLGDFNLGLSRLLERVRVGRGVNYYLTLGKFQVNTFYNQLLFFPTIKDQLGGSVQFKTKEEEFLVKLNAIRRNYADGTGSSFATSVESVFRRKKMTIKGEYGMSSKDNELGMGSHFDGVYRGTKLQLAGSFLYATAGFEGYYSDGLSVSSAVNYRFNKSFVVSASTSYNYITPKQDQIYIRVAPFYQNYFLSTTYYQTKKLSHRLSTGFRSNNDRSLLQKFDYEEQVMKYAMNYKLNYFSLKLDNAYSKTRNRLAGEQEQLSNSIQSALSLGGRINKNFKFGLSADYSNTNRYSQENKSYLFYGASVSYTYKKKIQLGVNYRNNAPLEEQYKESSLFSANISYQINKNHNIVLAGRSGNPRNNEMQNDYFYSAKYNVRIHVPTHKNRNVGHVKGIIKTEKLGGVEGIVLYLNGITAITNKKGEFEFNNLPPEKYFLTIETSSLKSDLICLEKLPKEIMVFAKKTIELELEFITPARIKGKVTYKKVKQFQSKEFKNERPNVIVKLTSGDLVFYTIIDQQGKFQFSQLKPGNYKVEIVTKGMERNFTFPIKNKTIEVKSGEQEEVELVMKDRSRKMNFSSKKIKLKSN